MFRKVKTLLSYILLSAFVFSLVTPAFAMVTQEENVGLTFVENYNTVLYVTESYALLLDEHSQQVYNTDLGGISITLPVTVRDADGLTQTTIDLTNISCLKNDRQRLMAAEKILDLAGFSSEIIAFLEPEQKIDMTTGLEFGVMRATAKAEDKVSNSYANWSSTLSYTRKSVNRYLFTNTANNTGAPYTWAPSIAVQGFSMEENTFRFRYEYDTQDAYTGAILNHKQGTLYNYSDGFESITSASSGTGVAFTFTYEPRGISTKNEIFTMSCYGTNSNVNPPTASELGGAFYIYGNVVLVTGPNPEISVSFPWGISVSGVASEGISCRTTLTAVLYK